MKRFEDLPEYPVKEPLTAEHRGIFDAYFASSFQESCELSFAEMFAWSVSKKIHACRLGPCICVFLEKNGKPYFYRPLGPVEHAAEAAKKIFGAEKTGMYAVEKGHEIIAALPGCRVTDEPDNYDYVYSSRELFELKGRKYDGKRNHLKKFMENEFEFREISPGLIPECLDFQKRWCSVRPCKEDLSLRDESMAVIRLLEHFEELPVFGVAIIINNRVEAYTAATRLNGSTATVIVEKADYEFRGIYQAINKLFCGRLLELGYEFVNRQQDTGDEGLKKAKLSYHPVRMIEKVTVEMQ